MKISSASVRTAAISVILLFSAYAFALQAVRGRPQYSWCAWEPLTLQARELNDANIYVFEDLIAYHIWFAGRGQPIGDRCFKVADMAITEDKAYFLPRGFNDVITIAVADINEPRLWIAYRSQGVATGEPPLGNFIVKGYHVADRRMMSAEDDYAIFLLLEK